MKFVKKEGTEMPLKTLWTTDATRPALRLDARRSHGNKQSYRNDEATLGYEEPDFVKTKEGNAVQKFP
jgi:hypothetical protein